MELTAETSSSWMLLEQDKHDGFYLFLNTAGTRPDLLLCFPVLGWPFSARDCCPSHCDCRNWNCPVALEGNYSHFCSRKLSLLFRTACGTQGDRGGTCSDTRAGCSSHLCPAALASPSWAMHISKAMAAGAAGGWGCAIPAPPPQEQWVRMSWHFQVSPGAMSQPAEWPWGWPRGLPGAAISYLNSLQYQWQAQRSWSPLNPQCCNHTSQTHSVFVSILLKPSCPDFPSPLRNLCSYCSVNSKAVQLLTSTAPLHFPSLMVPSLPTSEGIPNKHCCNLFTTSCLSSLGCTKHP